MREIVSTNLTNTRSWMPFRAGGGGGGVGEETGEGGRNRGGRIRKKKVEDVGGECASSCAGS